MDELWKEIGKILGLLLAGVFLLYAERARGRLTEWWHNRGLHPVARAVLTCRAVTELLVELRVTLKASRCYVVQFHNGQVFTSQNPVYRMSCTQETCGGGFVRVQGDMQNILVEQMWEEIGPLFGQDELVGVTRGHTETKPEKPPFRATYTYVTGQLPEGWFKSSLIARGTDTLAVSPILNARQIVVGFVVAEFNVAEVPQADLYRVTHAAANIWYELERHARRKG